jgi:hypothetical protein
MLAAVRFAFFFLLIFVDYSDVLASTNKVIGENASEVIGGEALHYDAISVDGKDVAKRLKILYAVLSDRDTRSSVKVSFVQSDDNLGFLLDVLNSSSADIDVGAKRLVLQNIEALAEIDDNKALLARARGLGLLELLREALFIHKLRTTSLMILFHLSSAEQNKALMASAEMGLISATCSLLCELYDKPDDAVSVATRTLGLRVLKSLVTAAGSTSITAGTAAPLNLEVLAAMHQALRLGNSEERKISIRLLVDVADDPNMQLALASRELGLLPTLTKVAREDYESQGGIGQYALMVLGQVLLNQPKARSQWSDVELNLTAFLRDTAENAIDKETRQFASKFLRTWSSSNRDVEKRSSQFYRLVGALLYHNLGYVALSVTFFALSLTAVCVCRMKFQSKLEQINYNASRRHKKLKKK